MPRISSTAQHPSSAGLVGVILVLGVSSIFLSSVRVGKMHWHIAWQTKQIDNVSVLASVAPVKASIQPTMNRGSYIQEPWSSRIVPRAEVRRSRHLIQSTLQPRNLWRSEPKSAVAISRIPAYNALELVSSHVRQHALWGWYAHIKKPGRSGGGELDRKVQQRLGNAAHWELPILFEMKMQQLSEGFTYFENLYFGGQFALDGGAPVDLPSPRILFFEAHEGQNKTGWDKHERQLRRAWGPDFFNRSHTPKFPGVSIGWEVQHVRMVDAGSSLKQSNNRVLVLPGLSIVLSDYLLFMSHCFHFQEVLMGTWAVYQTYAQRDQVKWIIFPNSQACKDYTPLFPDLLTEKYTCGASWRGKGLLNEQIIAAIFPKARVLTEVELVHVSSRSFLRLEKASVGDRAGAKLNTKARAWNQMLGGMTLQVSLYKSQFLARMKTGFGITSEMTDRKKKSRIRVTIIDRGETAPRRIQQHVKTALFVTLNRQTVPTPSGEMFRKDMPITGDRLFQAQQLKFQDFSFSEQVQVAMKSDVLIGRHGNGLMHALFMPADSMVVEIFSARSFAAIYQHLAAYAGHRHFAWDEHTGFIGRHDMEKCHLQYYRMCGNPAAGIVIESLDVGALVGRITQSVLSDVWPPISQDPCPVPNQCDEKKEQISSAAGRVEKVPGHVRESLPWLIRQIQKQTPQQVNMKQVDTETPIRGMRHQFWGNFTWNKHKDLVTAAGHKWCNLWMDGWVCKGERYEKVLRNTRIFNQTFSLDKLPRGTNILAHGHSHFAILVSTLICQSREKVKVWKISTHEHGDRHNTVLRGHSLIAHIPGINFSMILLSNEYMYWDKLENLPRLFRLLSSWHFDPHLIVLGDLNFNASNDRVPRLSHFRKQFPFANLVPVSTSQFRECNDCVRVNTARDAHILHDDSGRNWNCTAKGTAGHPCTPGPILRYAEALGAIFQIYGKGNQTGKIISTFAQNGKWGHMQMETVADEAFVWLKEKATNFFGKRASPVYAVCNTVSPG